MTDRDREDREDYPRFVRAVKAYEKAFGEGPALRLLKADWSERLEAAVERGTPLQDDEYHVIPPGANSAPSVEDAAAEWHRSADGGDEKS